MLPCAHGANHFWSPLLLIQLNEALLTYGKDSSKDLWASATMAMCNPTARARYDESLIIIIHKILLWEPARRETKRERYAAKQEGISSFLRGLLMSSSSPLTGNWSIPWRGGVLESVEQKPNHFRRLRPLGRRDADVGWRTPFLFASRSL